MAVNLNGYTNYDLGRQQNRLVSVVNKSGTITTGGTAQVAIAENSKRIGFWIQNVSAGDLYVNDVGTAAATGSSVKIAAGSIYESPAMGCVTGDISIFGATTAQAFVAREYVIRNP